MENKFHVPAWDQFYKQDVYCSVLELLNSLNDKASILKLYDQLQDRWEELSINSKYGNRFHIWSAKRLDKLMNIVGEKYAKTK